MAKATIPYHRGAIWGLATWVVIGFPITSWLYWPAILEANLLPPEADAVIIPMVESLFAALLLAPVVGLATWFCARRATTELDLLAWDPERPVCSTIVTLAFLPFQLLCIASIRDSFRAPPGWHGTWWLPYTFVVLCWLVLMRAAAIRR